MKNKDVLENAFNMIINKEFNSVQTGFDDIDAILSGTEKGSLIVIGSRPAMGKTALMMTIMEKLIRQNKKCLYCNLEMCNTQFAHRFLAQYAEFPIQSIRTGNINQKDIEKLSKALEEISNYDFGIIDDVNTIEEIEEKIKEFQPEYVFIDYLQLLQTNPKKQRCDEISNMLSKIKDIAKENQIFVFLTSQISRSVDNRMDKRPMLSDLRESSSIEEVSDVVLFVYRDEYYNFDCDDFYRGKAEIIVAKNKFGPVAAVNLNFNSSIPKFSQPYGNCEF